MDIPETNDKQPVVPVLEPYEETPVIMDNMLLVESYFRVMDKSASPLQPQPWKSLQPASQHFDVPTT